MGWVKAPFLTCVELHAFVLLQLKFCLQEYWKCWRLTWKALFPAKSKAISDTTPQCMSLSEQKNAAVRVVRSLWKVLPHLLRICVNHVSHLLLRVYSLNPLILMLYCCRKSLEKCSWQSEKWTGWQTDSLHRHSRKWCAEHKEACYSREIFGKPHGKAY